MNTTAPRSRIDAFLACPRMAVVGVSRKGGFVNRMVRALREAGCEVHPVHPHMTELDGHPVYPDLSALPPAVEALVVALPPARVIPVLEAAAALGLRRIWLQQGSDSAEALALARERQLDLIHGHCLWMFLPNARGLHAFHRRLLGWLGRLPS